MVSRGQESAWYLLEGTQIWSLHGDDCLERFVLDSLWLFEVWGVRTQPSGLHQRDGNLTPETISPSWRPERMSMGLEESSHWEQVSCWGQPREPET